MLRTYAEGLSHDQLARFAPAVFATAPGEKVSAKYSLLRTIDVIDALRADGWRPVAAGQGHARDLSRIGVQRHMVRFRAERADVQHAVGDVFPELVLTNSHDGATSYQLHAGVFRLVCSNGLVVADSSFAKVSIRHVGFTTDDVIAASTDVAKALPGVMGRVEAMRCLPLTPDEQMAFAQSAITVRYGEEAAPIDARQLLTPRRWDDKGETSVWGTYNRVQENLIRGGVRGRASTGRRMSTRAVGSVSEDMRLNKALWQLAEQMRQLKTAA